MLEEDGGGGGANSAGRLHIVEVAQREHLAADDAGHGEPAHGADGDVEQPDVAAEDDHQQDDQEHEGEPVEHVDSAHHERVDASPIPAGNGAPDKSDDERDEGGEQADHEADAGAVDEADGEVAAEAVGAGPEGGGAREAGELGGGEFAVGVGVETAGPGGGLAHGEEVDEGTRLLEVERAAAILVEALEDVGRGGRECARRRIEFGWIQRVVAIGVEHRKLFVGERLGEFERRPCSVMVQVGACRGLIRNRCEEEVVARDATRAGWHVAVAGVVLHHRESGDVALDQRLHDGEQADDQQEDQTDHGQMVLLEAAPGACRGRLGL